MRLDVPTLAYIFKCCPKLIGFSVTLPVTKSDTPPIDATPPAPTTASTSTLVMAGTTLDPLPIATTSLNDVEMSELGASISRLQYLLCEASATQPLSYTVSNVFASNLGVGLREVHFSGVDFLPDVPLCSRLGPNLEILRLTECSAIDDTTLSVVPLSCPKLRILDLWGSPSVTDASVVPIVRSCRELEAIDITFTSVSVATIESLASSHHLHAPNLHTIFMEGLSCPSTTLVNLIHRRGNRLRELILCGCLDSGTEVDDVLMAIAEHASSLRQLDVVGCVGPIAPAGGLEGSVGGGPRISSRAVWAVMGGCKRLETFALDEFAVEAGVFQELKRRFELEGVFVSPFWGVHF
ncbi:hypothetical protein HDU67_009785 [Dinochytrium kinnereticum]|nr:hypothetical protein HDU67_009785 [Dinochytrium kinnereticum]